MYWNACRHDRPVTSPHDTTRLKQRRVPRYASHPATGPAPGQCIRTHGPPPTPVLHARSCGCWSHVRPPHQPSWVPQVQHWNGGCEPSRPVPDAHLAGQPHPVPLSAARYCTAVWNISRSIHPVVYSGTTTYIYQTTRQTLHRCTCPEGGADPWRRAIGQLHDGLLPAAGQCT